MNPSARRTDMKTCFVLMLPGSCVGMVVVLIDALLRSSACCFRPQVQLDDVEPLRAEAFRRCHILVKSSMEMNLLIASCVRLGHPLGYPALAAADIIVGMMIAWCFIFTVSDILSAPVEGRMALNFWWWLRHGRMYHDFDAQCPNVVLFSGRS